MRKDILKRWKRKKSAEKKVEDTGYRLACYEHEPPWIGTVWEAHQRDPNDDSCPVCGNTQLTDIIPDP